MGWAPSLLPSPPSPPLPCLDKGATRGGDLGKPGLSRRSNDSCAEATKLVRVRARARARARVRVRLGLVRVRVYPDLVKRTTAVLAMLRPPSPSGDEALRRVAAWPGVGSALGSGFGSGWGWGVGVGIGLGG